MSENRTTAQLLSEHARLMNQHGPDSAEVKQFVEAHQDDADFIELSKVAALLKQGFLEMRHQNQVGTLPIIEYTNILHVSGGPDSKEARAYVQQHSNDPVFLKRAKVLNKVWKLKDRLKD